MTAARTNSGPRVAMALLLALGAAIGPVGSVLGQSPSPAPEPDDSTVTDVSGPVPSAQEVSLVLGIEVEAGELREDLSQLWEGADLDWQAVSSAQQRMYRSSAGEQPGPSAGVIVDIARFTGPEDAVHHVDETLFGGRPPGFATALSADFVATESFATDDGFGGSFIFVRNGPVVVAVTAAAADTSELEAATEAIVELVLGRLPGATAAPTP